MVSLWCCCNREDTPLPDKEVHISSEDTQSQTIVLQPLPSSYELPQKAREVLCDKVKKESPDHVSLSAAYGSMSSTPLPLKPSRPPTPPLTRHRDAQGFYFGEIIVNRPVISEVETVSSSSMAAKKDEAKPDVQL